MASAISLTFYMSAAALAPVLEKPGTDRKTIT
jgi:hypothetical protein